MITLAKARTMITKHRTIKLWRTKLVTPIRERQRGISWEQIKATLNQTRIINSRETKSMWLNFIFLINLSFAPIIPATNIPKYNRNLSSINPTRCIKSAENKKIVKTNAMNLMTPPPNFTRIMNE
jgi:hypothetical protein